MSELDDNPLVQVSNLKEWAEDLKEFMHDDDLSKALDLVVKIIAKPNVPQQQVATVCVELEAIALKFHLQYYAYMGFKKGTENAAMYKNMYRGAYEGIHRLVDALKYLVK
jgi:hypothetical protein